MLLVIRAHLLAVIQVLLAAAERHRPA